MMQTSIAGIPCQVRVIHYAPYEPASWHEPASGPEIEYEVYDRRGYKAGWLLAKLTDADDDAILEQYEASLRDSQADRAWT